MLGTIQDAATETKAQAPSHHGPPPSPPPSPPPLHRDDICVLLTGGTGFLGHSIVHRCLYDAVATKIYVLVRDKRQRSGANLTGAERFGPIKAEWVRQYPSAESVVQCISATMEGDDLGISASDRALLDANVTHIIHAAASVRFDEPALEALHTNVVLARRVAALGKSCARLEQHLHISTAYVHPPGELSTAAAAALAPLPSGIDLASLPATEETAASAYARTRGYHHNTYTWTKSIGEHAVASLFRGDAALPATLTIIRPSIIGPAWALPTTGWAMEASPAIGASLLFGCGVLRAAYVNGVRQNVVPADWVALDVVDCARARPAGGADGHRASVGGPAPPRVVHAIVDREDENWDHARTLAVVCDVFRDAADVQYRRAAPTLHSSWWRYMLHSTLAEDAHAALLRLVRSPAHRVLSAALVQRDLVLRTFAVEPFRFPRREGGPAPGGGEAFQRDYPRVYAEVALRFARAKMSGKPPAGRVGEWVGVAVGLLLAAACAGALGLLAKLLAALHAPPAGHGHAPPGATSLFAAFFAYQRDFEGQDAQRFFASHKTLPAVFIAAYLLAVRYLPRWMAERPPFKLRTFSRVWNAAIGAFSVFGAAVCVPHLIRQLSAHGLWYTVCGDWHDLAGHGAPALWAALFTLSKLFELVDTLLLIAKKRPVATLHWFHHSSVIGFVWAAWIYDTPTALWFGSMNYSVHAIMYSYFCLTAVEGYRKCVMRVAPAITSLQISQFAWGTVINVYAAVAFASPSIGCSIQAEILYLSAALYLVYGALFTRLFFDRYVRKRRPRERRAHNDDAHDDGCDDAKLRPSEEVAASCQLRQAGNTLNGSGANGRWHSGGHAHDTESMLKAV